MLSSMLYELRPKSIFESQLQYKHIVILVRISLSSIYRYMFKEPKLCFIQLEIDVDFIGLYFCLTFPIGISNGLIT